MAQTQNQLQSRLAQDMTNALRSGEKTTLDTIRLIRAEIQRQEKDKQVSLKDAELIPLLRRMIKQRKESLEHYTDAKRTDLARRESEEITIIGHYLPAELGEQAIEKSIRQAIKESGAKSMQDMGKVMAHVKALIPDTDMAVVAAKIKQLLN